MSSTVRAGSYRDVLLLPSALRTFVPALTGRLAYDLLPMSALFTVQQRTGSFAAAGTAVTGFGLASLSMPFKARLVDRYSQRRVLIAVVTVSGVFAPPLGPSMRSNWRLLTDGTPLKERAYALDAICEEP